MAGEIHRMLANSEIDAKLDETRGFDHGLFVPLKIMYPEANIPCVQLSLVNTLDPSQHIAIGRALQTLYNKNILLIGSGFSFHNLKVFFTPDSSESRQFNHAFEAWLMDVCSSRDYSEQERTEMLIHWIDAEGARYCHPREEHLLPLHVCYGASQGPSSRAFEITIMNKIRVCMFGKSNANKSPQIKGSVRIVNTKYCHMLCAIYFPLFMWVIAREVRGVKR